MANTRFGNFSNLVSDPKEYDKNAREGFNKLAETALVNPRTCVILFQLTIRQIQLSMYQDP